MAHPLFSRLPATLLLSAALLLGSCCANDVCDCNDTLEDAVVLRFAPAYTANQLDTIIIRRFPLPVTASTRPDSVVIIRTATRARDSILLNTNTPFTRVGTSSLGRYRYEVRELVQLPNKKPRPSTVFVIDSIQLRGSYEGDGCCTCYTNSRKVAFTRKPGLATQEVTDLKQLPRPVIQIPK